MHRLFSKVGAGVLIVAVIGLFIFSQALGVFIFTGFVINDASLSAAEQFALGSINGTVLSYVMLFTWLVMTTFIYIIISYQIRRLIAKQHHKRVDGSIAASAIHNTASNPSTNNPSTNNPSTNNPSTNNLSTSPSTNNLSTSPSTDSNSINSITSQVLDYLAIRGFSIRVALYVFGIWLLFLVISEAWIYILDKNPVAFIDEMYLTAQPKWMLILGMVVVAPIYEELMFRGILWSALKEQVAGRAGVWLASVVTSVLFAVIHFQYDWYEMSIIFVLALVFSLARHKSGSLLLPMVIHMLNNAVAMLQYVIYF